MRLAKQWQRVCPGSIARWQIRRPTTGGGAASAARWWRRATTLVTAAGMQPSRRRGVVAVGVTLTLLNPSHPNYSSKMMKLTSFQRISPMITNTLYIRNYTGHQPAPG